MRFEELSKNLGQKLTDAGDIAVKKSKEVAETLKNKGIIADEKRKLRDLYREVGRKYYEKCQTENESDAEFSELFESISACKRKIAEREAAIGVIKHRAVCSSCGETLPEDAVFCPKCGIPTAEADESSVSDEILPVATADEPTAAPITEPSDSDGTESEKPAE